MPIFLEIMPMLPRPAITFSPAENLGRRRSHSARWRIIGILLSLWAFTVSGSVCSQDKKNSENAEPEVDPRAQEMVKTVGKALSNQERLAYRADLSTEVTLDNGQKILIGGTSQVNFQRPNKLMMELKTDSINRLIYHDGEQLTIVSPDENYYGVIEAKSSSRDALIQAAKEFGIEVPLADLLEWGTKEFTGYKMESAFLLGEAMVNGKPTEHWAVRGPKLDWEVWVSKSAPRLPLKISTVNSHDPSSPRFTAVIHWENANSRKAVSYRPELGDKFHRIPFKKLKPAKEMRSE